MPRNSKNSVGRMGPLGVLLVALTYFSTRRTAGLRAGFPRRLGGYSFVKGLRVSMKLNRLPFAVYRDRSGKRYFVKQTVANEPSRHHYWQRNELVTNTVISEAYNANRELLNVVFPDVRFPRLVDHFMRGGRLFAVYEYVHGRPIAELPPARRTRAIRKAISFLQVLDACIAPDRKKLLTRRSIWYYLACYPAVIFFAVWHAPHHAMSILRLGIEFLRNIPFLVANKEYQLVHRDINTKNLILGDDGKYYLIDYEIAAVTFPIIEYVHALFTNWEEGDDFYKAVIRDIILKEVRDPRDRRMYRTFVLYAAIYHILVSSRRDDASRSWYLWYANSIRLASAVLVLDEASLAGIL